MNVTLADQVVQNIQGKPTEELLAIWTTNDREQWSAAAFDAISQVLSARGIIMPPQGMAVPPQGVFVPPVSRRYKGVRGGLLFFCIILTVLNPIIAIIVGLFGVVFFPFFDPFAPSQIISGSNGTAYFMLAAYFMLTAFSLYAGIRLWRIAPNAVKVAKMFVWCQLGYNVVSNLLLPITALSADSNAHSTLSRLAEMIFLNFLWFEMFELFFRNSKRVRATYGA